MNVNFRIDNRANSFSKPGPETFTEGLIFMNYENANRYIFSMCKTILQENLKEAFAMITSKEGMGESFHF